MPDWLVTIVLIVGFVLGVGLLFWWLIQKSMKRTSALQAFAKAKGWAFKDDEDPELIRQRFQSIPIFNKGNSFTCSNLILGKVDDIEIWACDYTHWGHVKQMHGSQETSVSSSQKQRQTIICLRLPNTDLPTFDITLNIGASSLSEYDPKASKVLTEDVFFDKKYLVCSASVSDKAAVSALMTENVLRAFPDDKKLKLQISGSDIMFTNYSLQIKTSELDNYIHTALLVGQSF